MAKVEVYISVSVDKAGARGSREKITISDEYDVGDNPFMLADEARKAMGQTVAKVSDRLEATHRAPAGEVPTRR